MKYFSLTDVGKIRKNNEDSYFSYENKERDMRMGLFLVADGMGGYENGEFASTKSVEIVKKFIHEKLDEESLNEYTQEYIQEVIYLAIQRANMDIFYVAQEKGLAMGTTFVLALIVGQKLFVANVGDSRVYVYKNALFQITKDNSYVQQLLESGLIDEDTARHHEDRNKITRAVGFEKDVQVDFYSRELEEGDKLLLCSDGLTSMVEDEDIQKVLREKENAQDICEKLLALANNNGGKDNITITVVIV